MRVGEMENLATLDKNPLARGDITAVSEQDFANAEPQSFELYNFAMTSK